MRAVRADGSADDPAALTLFAFCLFDSNFKLAAVVLDHNLGNDKRRSQLVLCFLEESKLVAACTKRNLRLEGALDGLVLDNGFKGLLDVVSQSVNLVPVCHEAVVDIEVELSRIEDAEDYITYETELTVPRPSVTGEYQCYAVGYGEEGQLYSQNSNMITLFLIGENGINLDLHSSAPNNNGILQRILNLEQKVAALEHPEGG